MKKRPACLVCLGMLLVVWLLRFLGFSPWEEPERERLEAVVRAGRTVQLQGQIQDYTDKENTKTYLIKSCILRDQEDEISLRKLYLVTQQEEHLQIGSRILVYGTLAAVEPPSNPGQFDAVSWYAAKGIYYTMWADEIVCKAPVKAGIREKGRVLRRNMEQALTQMLPPSQAGVMAAMLTGNKSMLDEHTKAAYRVSGVLHILSISGMHLTMLGMACYHLLRWLFPGRYSAALLSIGLMGGYTWFTGSGVAAVRAFLMFSLLLTARMLGRTYDSLSALAAAAFVTLAVQPGNLTYSGFWLSYLAVLGTVLVFPMWQRERELQESFRSGENCPPHKPLDKKERNAKESFRSGENCPPHKPLDKRERNAKESFRSRRRGKEEKSEETFEAQVLGKLRSAAQKCRESAAACTAVTLTLLPLTSAVFYEIPLFSIVPNLLLLPLLPLLLGAGMLGSLVGLASQSVGKRLLLPVSAVLRLYEAVTEAVQRLPGAVWICGEPKGWQIVGYTAGLVLLLWCTQRALQEKKTPFSRFWFSRRGRVGKGILLAGMLVCLFWRTEAPCSLTALDVGQGDAFVLRAGRRAAWLIDGGSSDEKKVGTYRILPYLKSQGIGRLEGIFVTHPDADHMNGVEELLALCGERQTALRIGALFLPSWLKGTEEAAGLTLLAEKAGTSVRYLQKGDTIRTGQLTLRVLHPDGTENTEDANAKSLVLDLRFGSFTALLTGDLPGSEEERLTGLHTKYDYLKVAHHGSKNSTFEPFLEIVRPQVSIISCSEGNRYGHPHAELLERLEAAGTNIYLTPVGGAIRCETDGKKFRISCFLEKNDEK